MRNLKIWLMVIALIVMASACAVKDKGPKAAATVNGVPIPEGVIKWKIKERLSEHSAQGARVDESPMRLAVIEQSIAERLLAEGGKEKGITLSDADLKTHIDGTKKGMGAEKFAQALAEAGITEKDYENMTRERMMSSMFTNMLLDESKINDDVLRDAYKNMQTPILMPDTVTMRFMQFTDEAAANKAVADIKAAGGNFDKVADSYQKNVKGVVVSGYGEVSPAMFDPNMGKTLKTMAPGAWAGPIKSKVGFYAVRLKQRNPSRPKTFDEAKGELRAQLLAEYKKQAIVNWVATRKGNSKIVVNK